MTSKDLKQQVDPSSSQFAEGVEAGLNSKEDTRNWQAGNELGQELKDGGKNRAPVSERIFKESPNPLFMRDPRGDDKGNAQDEKDETEE